MDTETATFSSGGKGTVKQILGSEERNKSKRRELWVTIKDLSKKVNHLNKFVWDYNTVDQVHQFHQNMLTSPYDGHYGLTERISPMLDQIASKTALKEDGDQQRKKR